MEHTFRLAGTFFSFRPFVRTWALVLLALFGAAWVWSDEQSQIDFANGLFSRGFYEEAADEYRVYLKEFPTGEQRQTAFYRLGESENAAGAYPEAIATFERLLRLEVPDDLRARATLRKGVAQYNAKAFAKARATLEALTNDAKDAGTQAEARYYLGKAHFGAGDVEAAMSAFQSLIRHDASNVLVPFARYQVAFLYLANEDVENAAVQFSEIAGDSSADPDLRMESRFRAAEAYDKIGWFDAAVTAYQQLQRDFPDTEYARRASYGYAWALYHAGKYDEAFVAAGSFLAQFSESPRRAGIAYLQGNALQQREKYVEALQVYASIREQYPDSEFAQRAHYKIAWVYHLDGQTGLARKEIESFLAVSPLVSLTGDAAYLLGTVLVAEGKYAVAQASFLRVYQEYPKSKFAPEAMYKSAECLARLQRADASAAAFARFSRAYPTHPLAGEALIRAADADFRNAAYSRAVEKYRRAMDLPLNDALEEELIHRLALSLHNMREYAQSVEVFGQLLEAYPDGLYVSEALVRTGDHLLRDKKSPLDAMKFFERAYRREESGAFAGRALQGLALARYQTKDYEGAVEDFLRVIVNFPEVPLNEETYAWVGQHLFDQEEWAQARTVFDALLKNVPDYPSPGRVLFTMAEASEKAGKDAEAISNYARVIAAGPKSPMAAEAQFRMAGLHEKRNETDIAMRLYEESANANSGETAARARFRLAELHEKNKAYDRAARNYMRVAILFFHAELSPEALWRAGRCFEQQNDSGQAMKTYEELLRDYPESEQAALAKARIESQ